MDQHWINKSYQQQHATKKSSLAQIEQGESASLLDRTHLPIVDPRELSPELTYRTISHLSHSERSFELESVRNDDNDDDADELILQGEATIPSEIANIAKNLVGGGVLSLSGGIAIYANSPSAVISAAFWIILMGVLLGYFALLIAKVCAWTNTTTYRAAWRASMGEKGGLAVSIANSMNPMMGDLAYAAILSQTFKSLLETLGIRVSRIESLLMITIFVLLPLCLLKNLYVLAPFSVFGTAGVILTAVAMVIRCVDGSYQPGGKFYNDIRPEYRPSFGNRNNFLSFEVLPLVCMLFQAYVMHYNCPRFYAELKDASVHRFARVVSGSFGLSSLLYTVIAAAGYCTFGGSSNSYILNNYSPHDPLATICRTAIAFSTLLTYPLAFIGFRDGVLDIFNLSPASISPTRLNCLTLTLLTFITLIACFVTDLGVINAITGGMLATAIVFVFPALMYRQVVMTTLELRHKNEGRWMSHEDEVRMALVLMVIGVSLGLIGTWQAIA
jgi:amino acid permease